jgi:protein gp37
MSEDSKIEWTDHTFNPWWGCENVSPGCDHCYAETFAKRTGHDVWGHKAPHRFFGEKHWNEPLKWDRAAAGAGVNAKVFCASMADVFQPGEDLTTEREKLWGLIEATPHLTWQLLTKRPERVTACIPVRWARSGWPTNVWLGTTVEDQQRADLRVPRLLAITGPAVRFLSCEPLLGPVELTLACPSDTDGDGDCPRHPEGCPLIDWVIAGGESGPGARPMHPDWARSLRDQCAASGRVVDCSTCNGSMSVPVPGGGMACPDCFDAPDGQGSARIGRTRFLFKQWGEYRPREDDEAARLVLARDGQTWDAQTGTNIPLFERSCVVLAKPGKKAAGRQLDGRTWDEYPVAS